jgi:hypothetical protein
MEAGADATLVHLDKSISLHFHFAETDAEQVHAPRNQFQTARF